MTVGRAGGERAQPWARDFARGRPPQVQRDVARGDVRSAPRPSRRYPVTVTRSSRPRARDVGGDVVVRGSARRRAADARAGA